MLNVNIKRYILLFLSTTLVIQAADSANAWYSGWYNALLSNIKKEHLAAGAAALGAAAGMYYLYNRESSPIEVQRTLRIINSIDPTLYAAIIKVDPTGKEHVKLEQDAFTPVSGMASSTDGLPVILFSKETIQELSDDHFRALVAHELGHYILGHNIPVGEKEITHPHLFKTYVFKPQEFTKGKKVRGQLPAKKGFENAYTRVQEYEADRSAILDFGIDVATAIEAFTILQNQETQKQREKPLMSTHPLGAKRIDQFKNLAKEVELRKARGEPRRQINWEEQAKEFLRLLNEKEKAREAAERRMMLNSVTSQFEDTLKENKDKLEAHEISEMEAAIEKSKSALKEHEHNADELQKAYDELFQAWGKWEARIAELS